MTSKAKILGVDEIKKELTPPLIPLHELIQYETWLNIPQCLINAQKHQ